MIASLITLTTFAPLTIRVDGRGFLRFDQGGKVVYASQATLVERGGYLATSTGEILLPDVAVPKGAKRIDVALDGTIRADHEDIGRIVLAQLPGESRHTTLFRSAVKPTIGSPGEGAFGVIRMSGAPSPAALPADPKVLDTHVVVVVRAETQIVGASYTLGDVADVTGSEGWVERARAVELGVCPPLGGQQLVSGPYVITKLRALGLTPSQFEVTTPQGARVVAKSQTIDPDAIETLARKALNDQYQIPFKLTATRAADPVVMAPGDYETRADFGARSATSMDVVVRFVQGGRTVGTRTVTFAPEPGTAQIRSGEKVSVRVIQRGATIELPAIARSSGFLGQPLTVETTGANSVTLTGVVKSAGVVEVRL